MLNYLREDFIMRFVWFYVFTFSAFLFPFLFYSWLLFSCSWAPFTIAYIFIYRIMGILRFP